MKPKYPSQTILLWGKVLTNEQRKKRQRALSHMESTLESAPEFYLLWHCIFFIWSHWFLLRWLWHITWSELVSPLGFTQVWPVKTSRVQFMSVAGWDWELWICLSTKYMNRAPVILENPWGFAKWMPWNLQKCIDGLGNSFFPWNTTISLIKMLNFSPSDAKKIISWLQSLWKWGHFIRIFWKCSVVTLFDQQKHLFHQRRP